MKRTGRPLTEKFSRINISTEMSPDAVFAFWSSLFTRTEIANLNKIPIRVRCKFYTLWLFLGWMPTFILDSRTSVLPKKEFSSVPSELSPISISSVLCHQFHKVLRTRLSSLIHISDFHFGFRSCDGIDKAV